MSLDNLKSSGSLNKLLDAAKGESAPQEKKSYVDERLWKPELDKSGNGYAVLRFLPAVEGEDLPWAKVWNHAFQGPTGQWYIENSDKEIARKQKRKLQYFSNIYVVSDTKHPENEGKVFLFRYGKKIFDKVTAAMSPEFEDEKAINPFDFWEGANFKLKIRKVDGYWNYDKSEFEDTSKLFEDDNEADKVWKAQHSLAEYTAPTNFKSYDELKTRLDAVLSGTVRVGNVADNLDDAPIAKPKVDTKPVTTKVETPVVEEDDTLAYFEKLAE